MVVVFPECMVMSTIIFRTVIHSGKKYTSIQRPSYVAVS